jgi:hypothetical protein
MNRRLVEMRLEQARRHVTIGEDGIARQRAVIDELVRDGHDATLARKLLRTFEALQAAHVAEAERLEASSPAFPSDRRALTARPLNATAARSAGRRAGRRG